VRNPLRDEASAFQIVWLTLGAAALIVAASWLSPWLGGAVCLVLVVAALVAVRGGLKERAARQHVATEVDRTHRILVIANETVGASELSDLLRTRAAGVDEDILVVCPALNSKLRTWTSDEDGARDAAQGRLDATIASLKAADVKVDGLVGDGDPLQALEDALRTFPADEIVISTHPPGRSHWLERGVVTEAERRYDVPVTHIVAGGGST
jgi:hypothetical protein